MTTANIGDALRLLGVGHEATRVYLALLDFGPAALGTVADLARLDRDCLRAAYAELVDAGLASVVADDGDLATPLPPAVGLEVLGRRRAAEVDQSRIAVANAFESFRRMRLPGAGDSLVEVVTGDAVGPRMRQAWVSARSQIRQFDSPPYVSIDTSTRDALDTLARGVVQRVVYSRESLESPGLLADVVEPCVAAGEQARVLPSVPVKLVIIDDAYALVSLSIREADAHNTMVIVQPCGLFSALVALFEECWSNALPLYDRGPAQRLLPADRRLLALLAAGVADPDIATQLGISRRTLFRRVELLMTRLGATTRFQLALKAHHRGWL